MEQFNAQGTSTLLQRLVKSRRHLLALRIAALLQESTDEVSLLQKNAEPLLATVKAGQLSDRATTTGSQGSFLTHCLKAQLWMFQVPEGWSYCAVAMGHKRSENVDGSVCCIQKL